MPRKKRSELTAGLFVVVALAVTLGVVLWLGASELLKTRGQLVSFYVPQSAGSVGIVEGTEVSGCDGKIGRIVDVEFQPDKKRCVYRAQLERKDITICSDGQAVVVSPPVGIAKVVVTDFGLDEKLADDDNPILLTGGLDQAMMSIGTAVDNLKSVSQTLKAELDPDRTEALLAKIHIIVDDLKMAAGHIAAITTDARPKVKKITTAMTETTERIEQYAKTDVAEILTKLRETNSEILQIAKDFRDVSTQAKEIMFVNRERIDEMIDNMTIVSANLKATSKEIRRNPWRLIYKPKPDEIHSQNIYDAARAFSNGAEQLDQAILKLTGLAKAHPEGLAADDPQLLKVRKQIEDAFLKFSKAEQSLWKELTK